jgi:Tfp pilus assembly protein PilZ
MPTANTKSRSSHKQNGSANGSAETVEEFVVKNVREFHAAYQPSGGNGGVFCPTRRKLQVGDVVSVKVRLGRRQPPMVVYGRVAWRRSGRHLLKIRAGIGVEFLLGEQAKCEYLLEMARAGASVRSRRRHERIPVDLSILWHPLGSNEGLQGKLRDVGRGGAFVLSTATVPYESQVVLEIAPPGAEVPMAFIGRVAWTGKTGEENVFGIEWRARDAGGGRRIKELVRRLTSAGYITQPH